MKLYPSISDDLREWIEAQPLFFVASAPSSGAHINLSPKGHPQQTFAILGPNHAAYIDMTGSGCETISHVYENGRVTIMFCSFGVSPRIMRLFCTGKVVEKDHPDFMSWVRRISRAEDEKTDEEVLAPGLQGARAVILLDVFKAQTSCGFGVPTTLPSTFESSATGSATSLNSFDIRPTLQTWNTKIAKSKQIAGYWEANNYRSLDGLPGLKLVQQGRGRWLSFNEVVFRATTAFKDQWPGVALGAAIMWVVFGCREYVSRRA